MKGAEMTNVDVTVQGLEWTVALILSGPLYLLAVAVLVWVVRR